MKRKCNEEVRRELHARVPAAFADLPENMHALFAICGTDEEGYAGSFKSTAEDNLASMLELLADIAASAIVYSTPKEDLRKKIVDAMRDRMYALVREGALEVEDAKDSD